MEFFKKFWVLSLTVWVIDNNEHLTLPQFLVPRLTSSSKAEYKAEATQMCQQQREINKFLSNLFHIKNGWLNYFFMQQQDDVESQKTGEKVSTAVKFRITVLLDFWTELVNK